MSEINKQVAYEDLMEKVMELVTVCGGWDDATEDFKPGVSAQIERIRQAAREGLELPIDEASP